MTRKPPRDFGQQWDKAGPNDPANKVSRRGRSDAETLLAVQLDQAGIPYEREYVFAPPRRWRADFLAIGKRTKVVDVKEPELSYDRAIVHDRTGDVLVEIDGGAFIAGRHSRGTGVEKDAEKQSAAAILGYRVIRCTPAQVNDGRALQWIQEALGLKERAA